MMLWFVALPLTTLAEITALGFTGPIFVTIGAALFLGEDVRLRRWIAVLVGFAGAMIIIRPGFSALHLGVDLHPGQHADLLGLQPDLQGAGAHRFGQYHRDLAEHRDRGLRRALRASGSGRRRTWTDLLWFVAAGLCGTLGHLCQQRGYQLADITLLQPIGFLSLIWNTLLGYLPVLPAARRLDLRRRGGDLRQRHVHLPPRGGAAGEGQDGRFAGRACGLTRAGGSAAGHAHVARHGRAAVAAVDDEVVALGLARDRLGDRPVEQLVALGGAQRRAQVGGVLLAEAHIERAGAGQPHAVAAFAEIVGERRDEAQPPAGLARP